MIFQLKRSGGGAALVRWTVGLAGTATLAAGLLVGSERSASAAFQYEWLPVPCVGAATSIAVGPNNIPWVVGMDGNIYYLSVTSNCAPGTVCQPTYAWARASTGFTATYVYVSLNGAVLALDAAGNQYFSNANCSSDISLPGPFVKFSTNQSLSGLAVEALTGVPLGQLTELFLTSCEAFGIGFEPGLWGVGTHGPGNEGYVYVEPGFDAFNVAPLTWTQVDPAAPVGALTITLFNNPGPPATQTPWITMSNQVLNLYHWDADQAAFVHAPGGGSLLTDHFIVGADGNVYNWSDAAQNWGYPVIGPTPGGAIGGLAYSERIDGTFKGTIGPSALWAIDANTHQIYFAIQPLPPPR